MSAAYIERATGGPSGPSIVRPRPKLTRPLPTRSRTSWQVYPKWPKWDDKPLPKLKPIRPIAGQLRLFDPWPDRGGQR